MMAPKSKVGRSRYECGSSVKIRDFIGSGAAYRIWEFIQSRDNLLLRHP